MAVDDDYWEFISKRKRGKLLVINGLGVFFLAVQ